MDIVGRHHDPFTVMNQWQTPLAAGPGIQPVTDLAGRYLARLTGVVVAYNALVLLSFPLSAAAAYALARHLQLSHGASAGAALAFAFSPFHLAQSAYHVHIAQTQWVPLYVLALWRCLDHPSPRAVALLAAAAAAVTFSNLYAGLIMAVMTPIAGGAYWWGGRGSDTRPNRRLAVTAASLMLIAAVAFGVLERMRLVAGSAAMQTFPRADLFRYSAEWWAYLMPPVASPLVGEWARGVWARNGVGPGLLEQQVSLGLGIVGLGLVAVFAWWRGAGPLPSRRHVPALAAVMAFAIISSLSPERAIGPITFVRPAALLYPLVPMFRSYARFGVMVQLMIVMLAGIGIDWLRRVGTRPAQVLCAALVILTVAEYSVPPSRLWRDVLPTSAHRWLMRQPGAPRALDCTRLDEESASVPELTGERIALLGGAIPSCEDTRLPETLAANGFSHLLVRSRTPIGRRLAERPMPDGLLLTAAFEQAQVFTVTAPRPSIYTSSMRGISDADTDAGRERRWLHAASSWIVVNTTTRRVQAMLALELSAVHPARLQISLRDEPVQMIVVDGPWQLRQVGPFTLGPGQHELRFSATGMTGRSDAIRSDDSATAVVAFGNWSWTVRGDQP